MGWYPREEWVLEVLESVVECGWPTLVTDCQPRQRHVQSRKHRKSKYRPSHTPSGKVLKTLAWVRM